jgi:hypothetical protein
VASFGSSDQIVADYERLLDEPVSIAIRRSHLIGLAFGLAEFIKMGTFAALYYSAAQFLHRGYIDPKDSA